MDMEGNIIFYTYGSTLELNGQQFDAGRLTEDLLNLSPDDYRPMYERIKHIRTFAETYEHTKDTELWWKLNDEMDALCQELRRYTVFRSLLDESDDAFFSVIREVTGQFSLFPTEKHEPLDDEQIERIRAAAEKFFKLNEADPAPEEDVPWKPLDLFRPSEADAELGEAFYYEMFRVLGETEGTWDT